MRARHAFLFLLAAVAVGASGATAQATDAAVAPPFDAEPHAPPRPPAVVSHQQPRPSAWTVLAMTTLMAACTGLGALPYVFLKDARSGGLSPRATALASAAACGVMLAAAFDLVHEGEPGPGGGLAVTAGILAGAAFVRAAAARLARFEHVKLEALLGGAGVGQQSTGTKTRAAARKNLLVVAIMAAHALGEGSGVGVSFCGRRGWAQGVLVTLAIGLHNVPEGLATATALVARGVRPRAALAWTLATAAPQPLVALPAFLFVDAFRAALPLAMGFAAGCMVWMVAGELLPDALAACGGLSRAASADGGGAPPPSLPSPQSTTPAEIATVLTVSAAALEALRMALATLETPAGTLAPPIAPGAAAAAARAAPGAALALVAAAAGGAGGAAATARWLLPAAGNAALGLAAGAMAWTGVAGLVGALRSGGGFAVVAAAAALGGLAAVSAAGRAGEADGFLSALTGSGSGLPRPPSRAHYHHLIAGAGAGSGSSGDLPTHTDATSGKTMSGAGGAAALRAGVGTSLVVLVLHAVVSGWATPTQAVVASLVRGGLVGGVAAALAAGVVSTSRGSNGARVAASAAVLATLRPLAALIASTAGAGRPAAADGASAAPAGVSFAGRAGGSGASSRPLRGLAEPAVAGAALAVALAVLLPAVTAVTKRGGRAAVVGAAGAAVLGGVAAVVGG